MAEKYGRGENPRSRANLGKPKTKAGRFNFTLSKESVDWLSQQSNKSDSIDKLIKEKSMKLQSFTFARRTHDLPDGIDGKRTFEAASYREALQMASDYWFNGAKVGDTLTDSNGVITLTESGTGQGWGGNVIGTLMER